MKPAPDTPDPEAPAPDTPARGVWAAGGCLVLLAAVFAFGLYLVQAALDVGYWVLNLAAFAPLLAAGVTVGVGRAAGWSVRVRPGLRLDGRGIRRTIALFVAGWAVVLGALQGYAALRWPLKHLVPDLRPHPLLSSLTDPANLVIWLAIGCVVSVPAGEFGWRAVLQPTLRQRLGPIPTAVVIGVGNAWVQMPWWAGMIRRYELFGNATDVVFYVLFAHVSMVAVSLIVTIGTDPMVGGRWYAATAYAWPIHFGLLIVLDEEWGRWQAHGVIAISALLWTTLLQAVREGLPGPLRAPEKTPADVSANEPDTPAVEQDLASGRAEAAELTAGGPGSV